MEERFLFINPRCVYFWDYIPMGVFGLCDQLARRGVEARILNAPSFDYDTYPQQVEEVLRDLRPAFVGVPLHWKETLLSSLYLTFLAKRTCPQATVVVGGITAGFLAEELLSRHDHIDFVIKGDAEESLAQLVSGSPAGSIPNLVYRERGTITSNPVRCIDQETFDETSYADLAFLHDPETYLEQANSALGFPIMLARGCRFECQYCGGSKSAFEVHSGRSSVIRRGTGAVIRDLRRLAGRVDTIYLCHETSLDQILDLFRAIADAPDLAGKFRCNYGSWRLPDREFLELYSRAFRRPDEGSPPTIEISPETSVEADRRVIRDPQLFFTNAELQQALEETVQALDGHVRILVFFSRYHTSHSAEKVEDELRFIHRLRVDLFEQGSHGKVRVLFNDLATDPASHYWNRARESGQLRSDSPLETLLGEIRSFSLAPFGVPSNNLCFFRPAGISEELPEIMTTLNGLLSWVLDTFPEYYFLVTKVVGFDSLLAVLREIAEQWCRRGIRIEATRWAELLEAIRSGLEEKDPDLLEGNTDFWSSLHRLAQMMNRGALTWSHQGSVSLRGDVVEARPIAGQPLVFFERPRIDPDYLLEADFDFYSMDLYRSLDAGLAGAVRRPTVYLFLPGGVAHFDRRHLVHLRRFDGTNRHAEVLAGIRSDPELSAEEHENLCDFLDQNAFYLCS